MKIARFYEERTKAFAHAITFTILFYDSPLNSIAVILITE
jgi:hypothetical protein